MHMKVGAAGHVSSYWNPVMVMTGLEHPGFCAQVNGARGGEGVAEVRRAYEYTLDRVGTDIGASAPPLHDPLCTAP